MGYLDYRDALACNKYILETKRHGDYHQQARAQVLGLAFARYGQLKKDEIEKKAAKTPQYAQDKEEAKLQLVLNNDSDMARLYRETY